MADFIGYHGAGDDHRQFKLITDRNRLGIRPAEHVRILNFFNIFIMMKIIIIINQQYERQDGFAL